MSRCKFRYEQVPSRPPAGNPRSARTGRCSICSIITGNRLRENRPDRGPFRSLPHDYIAHTLPHLLLRRRHDYPAWFRENGGSVLSTTINKYCHISCRYCRRSSPTSTASSGPSSKLVSKLEKSSIPPCGNACALSTFMTARGPSRRRPARPCRARLQFRLHCGYAPRPSTLLGQTVDHRQLATEAIHVNRPHFARTWVARTKSRSRRSA